LILPRSQTHLETWHCSR